jgi:hypothetical protein
LTVAGIWVAPKSSWRGDEVEKGKGTGGEGRPTTREKCLCVCVCVCVRERERERVEEEKVCELRKSWEFGKQEVVREGQT